MARRGGDDGDGANTAALLQGSFASGELAPALYARTDLAKFHSGAKLLRNFFVQSQGGVLNRAGTQFCGFVPGGDVASRLIPFSFNLIQTYAILLVPGAIYFIANGPNGPGFVTADGTPTGSLVTATTPYVAGDLFDITFTQSADVLTLCHPSYPPAQVTRESAISWVYAPIKAGSQLKAPNVTLLHGTNQGYPDGDTNIQVLPNGFEYAVTACKINPPDESALGNSMSCVNYDLGFNNYGVYNDLYWVPPTGQAQDYFNVYRYFLGAWSFCASTVGRLATGGNGETGGQLALNWKDTGVTPDTNTTPPQNTNPFYESQFTGSISGSTLSISSFGDGTIAPGDLLAGQGVAASTSVLNCISGSSFTGSINGTILTATAFSSGNISVGDEIILPGTSNGPTVTAIGAGQTGGGAGTYGMSANNVTGQEGMLVLSGGAATFAVSNSQTVASETMMGPMGTFTASITGTVLSATGLTAGTINLGDTITGTSVSSGTTIASNLTGASIIGQMNGKTLQVLNPGAGEPEVGNTVVGPSISSATTITSIGQNAEAGGDGTYVLSAGLTTQSQGMMSFTAGAATFQVSQAQNVTSTAMTGGVAYPSACCYFQQRAVFGGPNSNPQGIVFSRSGNYANFNASQPIRDDDAISLTIASSQVNSVRHLVAVNDLIVFTNSSAWKLSGQSNSGDVITPSNVVCVPQAYNGCSNVPPIVVSPNILYVQEKGNTVRDLSYNIYANLYSGTDISILSSHLFFGYSIVDWCFAREPWKIVWATRNDGTMLGLTYSKDQDVYAWHHHDTAPCVDGSGNSYPSTFESVCSISEGQEDVVYCIVRRFLNGAWTRTVERMQSRILGAGDSDITAAWFVDCGLQYSGPPATTVTGLTHLVGQTVSILADGAVKSQQVVPISGAITINVPASVITVGLPIQAQMETLPLDASEPTVQGKYKRVTKLRLYEYNTRGLKAGAVSQSQGPLLQETGAQWGRAVWGSPPALYTGQTLLHIPGVWDTYGTLFVQQDYPLPACLLGIEPWVSVGE